MSKKTVPQISWIKEIVEAAHKVGCKVFLKDNLSRLCHDKQHGKMLDRQELPQ